MKTAILIHGWPEREEYFDHKVPSPSNNQWFPWLQRQLLLQEIEAQTPEMPRAYEPNYEKWKELFERLKPDEETILVGHSCGGGFLVRWLTETHTKVGRVVLVAPWLDPDRLIDPAFFDFQINAKLAAKTKGVIVMYSTDDYSDVLTSIDTLKTTLVDVTFCEFVGKGHFCIKDLHTDAFPELLEEILK